MNNDQIYVASNKSIMNIIYIQTIDLNFVAIITVSCLRDPRLTTGTIYEWIKALDADFFESVIVSSIHGQGSMWLCIQCKQSYHYLSNTK